MEVEGLKGDGRSSGLGREHEMTIAIIFNFNSTSMYLGIATVKASTVSTSGVPGEQRVDPNGPLQVI